MEKLFVLFVIAAFSISPLCCALVGADDVSSGVDVDLGAHHTGGVTDDNAVAREAQAMAYTGFSVHERQMLEASQQHKTFEADVSRVLGIIINSLYSNKEVFLRELISNASDALDKIRLLSLTDASQLDSGSDLEIRIKADPDAQTLTITDTGVGMTAADLESKLGSIASSGTKQFVEAMQTETDTNSLIGQFGVGFYAVFLAADEVTVISKHNDDDQHVWVSDGTNSYTLSKDPRGNTLGRGTQIIMKLKEDALEFTDNEALLELIQRYSAFINFPIYLWNSKEVEVPVEATEDTTADEGDVEDVEDDEETAPETTTEIVWDWELVNSTKPIWTRSKNEITEEEYHEFYKSITGDESDPLAYVHFSAEGEIDFKSILYIPAKAPSDLFSRYATTRRNIKLYVRRVFITDDFKSILPQYMAFVRGLVDSDSLPLSVSRETLQERRAISTIRKKLTRKVLDLIRRMARDEENPEKFDTFWKEYGTSIKLGLMEDTANRTKLSKLLRYESSKSDGEMTSLEDYCDRMPEGQDKIYYLAGENYDAIERSPYLERLLRKDIEVLFLVDPVDEYTLASLPEFDGNKLVNVAKEGLDSSESEEAHFAQMEEDYADFLMWIKLTLSEHIEKAVLSKRLVDSPAALVASAWGYSPAMERIAASQARAGDDPNAFMLQAKKDLELNPFHGIIKHLKDAVAAPGGEDDPENIEAAHILFETASLGSGYSLWEPTEFVGRVHRLLALSQGLDPNDLVDYSEIEEAEEIAAAEVEDAQDAQDAQDGEDGEDEEVIHEEL